MLTLITGGSGSGKSAFAEELACRRPCDRKIYLATMSSADQESRARIQRHRAMRSGKGFETVERYLDLAALDIGQEGGVAVLLECMSNLTANEMFDPRGCASREGALAVDKRILEGVRKLKMQCTDLIIVTNEIFSDGIEYDTLTQTYQQVLGSINAQLAQQADAVYEVVYGLPVCLKGPEAGA